ncbi:MAG: DUF6029 family protein [Ignavibacteriales bacterium]|nr:MAG: hypothetical protein F9K26_05000 [Ignavibacteriaceae bacterium]MBW7872769.1 hypothetical protein [Ignavibacteria bacterium]MCZ2143489.1 DUF6029 family protein [Ignavibacteriales bacterium]MBV6444366.1 hypothetical protein [Ignavibacteriaceae bacterium]MBZ0197171.1 DUF6029 family protein [Ignavibacteriaceae bacterium]
MKKSLLFIVILASALFAQELPTPKLPTGLSIMNRTKASYDFDNKTAIFEDWLNIDYRYENFSAGLRYETFKPNDPSPAISRGKENYSDIAFKYFGVSFANRNSRFELTAGNFYALIGRGLILRSYEDRNLRLDNNLEGAIVKAGYGNFRLTMLVGSAANSNNERKDILSLADLEYRGPKWFRPGVTLASNKPDVPGVARTDIGSLRLQSSFGAFDGYVEYGLKKNPDLQNGAFGGKENFIGEGFYASGSFYYDIFSVTGEYKYYDNFGFRSFDQSINYNQPPATRRDYSYQLFNRHPSTLDPDNEQGYQIEANAVFTPKSSLMAQYSETKTLGNTSYIQRIYGQNLDPRVKFREFSAQYSNEWSSAFKTTIALGYNEELDENTKNYTGVFDMRYSFDPRNTIRLIAEHQQTHNRTTDEKYFSDVLTVEYLNSPKYSIAWVSEMKTREPVAGNTIRVFWNYILGTVKLGEHTDLSLLAGSREAGIICIGGVCRYEPEFRGLELKMTNRF